MYNLQHFLVRKIMLVFSFASIITLLSACSSNPSDKLVDYLVELGWECFGTVCENVSIIDDDADNVNLEGLEKTSTTVKYDGSIAKFTISRTIEFSGLIVSSSEYITRYTIHDLDIFLSSGQVNMYSSETFIYIEDGAWVSGEAVTSHNLYNGIYQCDKSGDLDICSNTKDTLEFQWELLVILINSAGLSLDDFKD